MTKGRKGQKIILIDIKGMGEGMITSVISQSADEQQHNEEGGNEVLILIG